MSFLKDSPSWITGADEGCSDNCAAWMRQPARYRCCRESFFLETVSEWSKLKHWSDEWSKEVNSMAFAAGFPLPLYSGECPVLQSLQSLHGIHFSECRVEKAAYIRVNLQVASGKNADLWNQTWNSAKSADWNIHSGGIPPDKAEICCPDEFAFSDQPRYESRLREEQLCVWFFVQEKLSCCLSMKCTDFKAAIWYPFE